MDFVTDVPPAPRELLVWQHAAANLRAGIPVALLCVPASQGSSPGRQGFKMTVTAASLAGSIGGGMMEHKFVELARALLRDDNPQPLLRQQIHQKEASTDRSGMICSGEQWVLVFPLRASDLPAVVECKRALRELAPVQLEVSAQHGLHMLPGGAAPAFRFRPGPDWYYSERLGFRDHATIVGAGHVSLALSRVLTMLDFELTVLDDRPCLNTHLGNSFAHHKRTVRYEELEREIPESPNQYVVLMTFSYRTDLVALRQLLRHPVRYLGVLGSAAKIAELLGTLRAEGVPEEQLARLHAPIGLPIHSRTPEEIAVSIAAEIIQERNRLLA